MWVTPWYEGGMGVVTSLSWSVTVWEVEVESEGVTGRESAGWTWWRDLWSLSYRVPDAVAFVVFEKEDSSR
jgi:hypothetical protein